MEFITNHSAAVRRFQGGCVATIGNFDGLHKGHQYLIAHTVSKARQLGLPSAVLTFDPHPQHLFTPSRNLPLLMTVDEKQKAMAELGVDVLFTMPFTFALASLSPEEFVRRILYETMKTRYLYVGYDYAFGKGRQGDAAVLERLGGGYAFEVEQAAPVYVDGVIASSTVVRQSLQRGCVQEASRFLGKPYLLSGKVVHGQGRGGRQLGFPTANLEVCRDKLLPGEGVYAVRAAIQGDLPSCSGQGLSAFSFLSGVASVGSNPTFQDGCLRVEVHLLQFCENIYDRVLHVFFLDRLRGQQVFSGPEELAAQIRKDISLAKIILSPPGQRVSYC